METALQHMSVPVQHWPYGKDMDETAATCSPFCHLEMAPLFLFLRVLDGNIGIFVQSHVLS
jgi:hypothetical protein